MICLLIFLSRRKSYDDDYLRIDEVALEMMPKSFQFAPAAFFTILQTF